MTTLSQPLSLPCGAVLPNRIAKSAMSERLGDVNFGASDGLVNLYARWGAGGAGLLITGNVMVDRRAIGEAGNVVIEDEKGLPMLRRVAAAGRAGGGAVWVQLNHPGRQAPRPLVRHTVAPSAVSMKGMGPSFAPPRALIEEEILEIIERFANAARITRRAGFNGVQIHGAHGYLVSQFLSPLSNLRSDRWGGSLENRMRFLLEIVRAVRSAVGADFPIGVKMNSADFQRGGFSPEDAVTVAQALEAAGIDLLEISGGTYERPVMFAAKLETAKESTRAREGYFLAYAEKIRAATTLPLMLTGGFRTLSGMEEAIAAGIDVAGMARVLAVEPELPKQMLSGQTSGASALGPAPLPHERLNGLVQPIWYGEQLMRLGRGQEPDAALSPYITLGKYFLRALAAPLRLLWLRLTLPPQGVPA